MCVGYVCIWHTGTPLLVFALRFYNLTMPSTDRTPVWRGYCLSYYCDCCFIIWHRAMMVDYKIRDWEEPLSEGNLKKTGTIHLGGNESKRTQWRYCRMHSLEIAVGELLFTLSQNIGMQEHKEEKKGKWKDKQPTFNVLHKIYIRIHW